MIKWVRRRRGEHFGRGELRHNYRATRWSDGWVLSQTSGGEWHWKPGTYRTLRDAKAAANALEMGVA